MISKDSISKVLDVARIEEVVGDYVHLKKRGSNLLGLCPFHNEKTPSFNVSPAKGIFKCFGCGQAGDSVRFLMEHDKLSFSEAIRNLAKRYNIELEETKASPENSEEQSVRESLYLINAFAQKFYASQLYEHAEGKSIGLPYLKERQLRQATIDTFGLGFAPSGRKEFRDAALKAGYRLDFAQKLGLLTDYENQDAVDYFHSRVIFPFFSPSGKVLGFGARTLKQDKKEPKYLNSKESEVYQKSETLFGIFQAKKEIRTKDEIILCEGYLDVISLYQAGIQNAVASSGTSLTQEQARQIRRLASNVRIMYDGDEAGKKASLRAIEILLEEGLNIKLVDMPVGEDPDSLTRQEGWNPDRFLEQNTLNLVQFIAKAFQISALEDPVLKTNKLRDSIQIIGKVQDPVLRAYYSVELSKIFQLEEKVVLAELNKDLLKKRKQTDREAVDISLPDTLSETQVENQVLDTKAEKELLRLILQFAHMPYQQDVELGKAIFEEVKKEHWNDPTIGELFALCKEKALTGELPTLQNMLPVLRDDLARLAIDIVSIPHELSQNWMDRHGILIPSPENNFSQDLSSTMALFQLRSIQQLIRENQELLNHPQSEDELTETLLVQKLLEEKKKEIAGSRKIVILRN